MATLARRLKESLLPQLHETPLPSHREPGTRCPQPTRHRDQRESGRPPRRSAGFWGQQCVALTFLVPFENYVLLSHFNLLEKLQDQYKEPLSAFQEIKHGHKSII